MEIGWKNQSSQNETATAQSTYPSPNKPGNPPSQQQQQQTVTGNQPTVASPYQPPPNSNDHWQGGQANPNGTQNAAGQQTGGRYVDSTYQTDATGRHLSADEQAYWRNYDRLRAENASIARSNAVGGGASNGLAVDAPVYDPNTDTYSFRDSANKWHYNVSAADIYNQLDDNVKKQYPEWYFGEYAQQQQVTHRANLDSQASQNEAYARMGQQSTRYAPTSF